MQWTKPGLIVAPLTPFTRDLEARRAGARTREIDYCIETCDATMIVAAGVEAQEYTYLSLEERKTLIRRTIELVGGRRPVMVGISHPSFRTAIELAHFAEGLGAAAVQMLAPLRAHGGPPTDRDLVAYFEAVGRETSPAGDALSQSGARRRRVDRRDHRAREARHACASSRKARATSRACRGSSSRSIMRATPSISPPCRCCSRRSSSAARAPPCRRRRAEIARHIIDAYAAGEHERAAEYQLQFALFPARWMHRGLTPTMKAAMRLIGMDMGDPYPPYAALDADEVKALEALLGHHAPGAARTRAQRTISPAPQAFGAM